MAKNTNSVDQNPVAMLLANPGLQQLLQQLAAAQTAPPDIAGAPGRSATVYRPASAGADKPAKPAKSAAKPSKPVGEYSLSVTSVPSHEFTLKSGEERVAHAAIALQSSGAVSFGWFKGRPERVRCDVAKAILAHADTIREAIAAAEAGAADGFQVSGKVS